MEGSVREGRAVMAILRTGGMKALADREDTVIQVTEAMIQAVQGIAAMSTAVRVRGIAAMASIHIPRSSIG